MAKLKLDLPDSDEILASSDYIVLTRNRNSGRFYIWRLDWYCSGLSASYNSDKSSDAWATYIREITE